MPLLNVYIDGFNLYHAIDAHNEHRLKWINLLALGYSFLRPQEELNRVVFFTAMLNWDKEKQQRHRNFIAAQKAIGVEVVESNFKKVSKHCRVMNRYCDRHEEKQTDVAIAISVYSDALSNDFDRAVLVTADSDQIPLVAAVRKDAPLKRITLAAPPGRSKVALELGGIVHDRTPLSVGRLRACPLPRDVYDTAGNKAGTMPALYRGTID